MLKESYFKNLLVEFNLYREMNRPYSFSLHNSYYMTVINMGNMHG